MQLLYYNSYHLTYASDTLWGIHEIGELAEVVEERTHNEHSQGNVRRGEMQQLERIAVKGLLVRVGEYLGQRGEYHRTDSE